MNELIKVLGHGKWIVGGIDFDDNGRDLPEGRVSKRRTSSPSRRDLQLTSLPKGYDIQACCLAIADRPAALLARSMACAYNDFRLDG